MSFDAAQSCSDPNRRLYRFLITLGFVTTFYGLVFNPCYAFFEWEKDAYSGSATGVLRSFAVYNKNPSGNIYYDENHDSGLAFLGRVVADAYHQNNIKWSFNAYQTYIPLALSAQAGTSTQFDVERSSALEWSFSDSNYVHFAIDQAYVKATHNNLDITLGRQPINLATTYYFTPNDLFAPFAAQTFYRVYKPGVDAARAEYQVDELSLLSFYAVLGFEQSLGSDTGWSTRPDAARNTYLARYVTTLANFGWSIIGGSQYQDLIVGGALQGEIFNWLGIRGEGHFKHRDNSMEKDVFELAIGLEHRWESSLELRLEQFYHGGGASHVEDYISNPDPNSANSSIYLAKNYSAAGLGYEITPLLRGDSVFIFNWLDHSALFSVNAIYSLSDESEFSFYAALPVGDKPQGAEINSEFGLYPYSVNIEIRGFF